MRISQRHVSTGKERDARIPISVNGSAMSSPRVRRLGVRKRRARAVRKGAGDDGVDD
jgi:hypothetical protein